MEAVKVTTPSRLHLGQIDLNGSLGRIYGGMGVALDRPNCILQVTKAHRLEVQGPQSEKVSRLVDSFLSRIRGRGLEPPGGISCRIEIQEAIPNHNGLGSGTQLGLGLALALTKLCGLDLKEEELVHLVDRGNSRSAIGYGAFLRGGFVLDGGRPLAQRENDQYLPPVIFQHPFPQDWYFILVVPWGGKRGLSGSREREAFVGLPPMDFRKVEENCRLVLLQVLPGIMEEDIDAFGLALTKIQENVGDYFSSIQGDRLASPKAQAILDKMLELGAKGVGQSSWGPLLYGLVKGWEAACRLEKDIRAHFGRELAWTLVARGENRGATWQAE